MRDGRRRNRRRGGRARGHPPPWLATVRALVDRWLRPRPRARTSRSAADRASRGLRCDLYLASASESLRLFPAGPVDPLRLFQRAGVVGRHQMEFVTRLDPGDAGTEDYQPYGLFNLREETARLPLPAIKEVQDFWTVFLQVYGLVEVPRATDVLARRFTAHDARRGTSPRHGANRLRPRKYAPGALRSDGTVLPYGELLDLLARELRGPQRVAWVEEAFTTAPPPDEAVHRYYLDAGGQLYLVRHDAEGKRLYLAETSAEAQALCQASGAFARPGRRAA